MKTPEKKPRVSIGLPVYNCEKYVGGAIESVLSQTFEDFELIISDNASTDRTAEICRQYAAKDSRIRYYRNEKNLGAAKNFNRVFKLASGQYFKWIAADCTIEPEFLERCLDILENDPKVILVFTKLAQRSEFNNTIECHGVDFDFRSSSAHQRFQKLLQRRFAYKVPIWGLARLDVLRQTSLIRPFIGSDDCLLIELVLKGGFGLVPQYLGTVRRHPQSYTNIKDTNDGVEGAAEAKWFDPENKGTCYLPHWRRLWEYFILVIHSKEKLGSKFIMVAFLVHPISTGWLKKLIKELFFIAGLKDIYSCMKKLKNSICKHSTPTVGQKQKGFSGK